MNAGVGALGPTILAERPTGLLGLVDGAFWPRDGNAVAP